ncbi:MAG: MJ1477/TM1410 family putative glycoside hydrolase [Candidatus Omnitrophota bacterium]
MGRCKNTLRKQNILLDRKRMLLYYEEKAGNIEKSIMKNIRDLCITVVFLFLVLGAASAWARTDLSGVESWACWLQAANIQTLSDSPYDLVVMDYSFDGTDDSAYTPAEIQSLKNSGKQVLSYFSIGEAEDYRFYWQDGWSEGNPSFLGPENEDWQGNYKVKYWEDGWWQDVLNPYLDKIISAGFNGVYLDIIDAYYYWYESEGGSAETYADDMAELVGKIADYSRNYNADFIICPQNGIGILDDASIEIKNKYINTIDCVGMESLFYNIWSEEDQTYRFDKLEEINQAGKPIFNIEYIDPDSYGEYFDTLEEHPFNIIGYPAASDRALDELIVPAGAIPEMNTLWLFITGIISVSIITRKSVLN